MIKAIIFDLDGLIADTESYHFQAYKNVFAKYGINITEKEYAEDWINNGFGVEDTLRKYNVKTDAVELRREKTKRYLELVDGGIEPMPRAISLINALCREYTLAVASSSRRKSVNAVLEKLRIKHHFKVICSRECTKKKKPDPSIFLATAKKLNVNPNECLVIEDAKKGVEAAKLAGMKCIAVPNKHTKNQDLFKADLVVRSLGEINLKIINELCEGGK